MRTPAREVQQNKFATISPKVDTNKVVFKKRKRKRLRDDSMREDDLSIISGG